jgi:toxin ParE1/3/4
MKIEWSKAAIRDLEEVAGYLATQSERLSNTVERRIQEEANLLFRFPRGGRIGRIAGTRERVVGKTPYILAYRILTGRVRILRVYHGARQWPKRFD